MEREFLSMTEMLRIEGTLLALDNTPYAAVPVQAVIISEWANERMDESTHLPIRPFVIATTLSDEAGRYRFINLKPGLYQVRCHVGQTDAQLMARLQQSPRIRGASAFLNQAIAESVISQTIRQNRPMIQQWLRSGSSHPLVLQFTGQNVIGRGILRGQGAVYPMTNARVLLRRAPNRGANRYLAEAPCGSHRSLSC